MERKIINCVQEAENIAKRGDISEIKENIAYFERWLLYFQHERLIHLIVTALFSLLSMLSLILYFNIYDMAVLLFFLIFVITDCFYIRHYYILENKVQHLYDIIDIFYIKIK